MDGCIRFDGKPGCGKKMRGCHFWDSSSLSDCESEPFHIRRILMNTVMFGAKVVTIYFLDLGIYVIGNVESL